LQKLLASDPFPCAGSSKRRTGIYCWCCGERLEDHTVGFRLSERYEQRRKMLHHFYEPFPVVEHYGESVDLRKSVKGTVMP
jgi:hypothetical protein